MANTFAVVGDLTVAGAATVAGALTASGTLSVTGASTLTGAVGLGSAVTRTTGSGSYVEDLASVTTTDATVTTAASYAVPNSGEVAVSVHLVAPRSDGAVGFSVFVVNSARRSGAAAPTLSQGSAGIITATLENTYGGTKPTLTFAISGNNIEVRITGQAATTINWAVRTVAVTR